MARQHLFIIGLCALTLGCAPQIHAVQDYQAAYICDGSQPVHVIFGPAGAGLENQCTFVRRHGDGLCRFGGRV